MLMETKEALLYRRDAAMACCSWVAFRLLEVRPQIRAVAVTMGPSKHWLVAAGGGGGAATLRGGPLTKASSTLVGCGVLTGVGL